MTAQASHIPLRRRWSMDKVVSAWHEDCCVLFDAFRRVQDKEANRMTIR